MKRIFAILLTLCLLLSLVACGEPESNDTKKPNNEKPGETKSTEALGPMKTIYVITSITRTNRSGEGEPSIITTRYTYDEGRMINAIQNGDGSTVEFTTECDEYGRVTLLRSIYEGGETTIAYTYDEVGNLLCTEVSQDGQVVNTQRYTYDADGNKLSQEMQIGDYYNQRIEYIYEQGCLVKEITYRDGVMSQYQLYFYDDNGLLIKSETRLDNDSLYCTWDYTYSEDGLTTYKTCERYKLSTVTTRDEHGNIIRTENIDAGSTNVMEYTFMAIEIPADTPRKNDVG